MAITNWPKADRPREKLFTLGAKNLTDAELLAIFFNTGVQGKSAVELARELLMEFGSLKKILSADASQLFCKKGFGKAKFAAIKAAEEISLRTTHEIISQGEILRNSDSAKKFIAARLQHHQKEVFACLFLTTRHRIIAFEELFYGTIDEASVHPREVVKRALSLNAAKIIFAHNHPSGNPTPSIADIDITRVLVKALLLVDIIVLDHIVVGENVTFSFADEGMIF